MNIIFMLLVGLLTLVPGAPPRQVSFDTADGGHIVGDLYGDGADAVVLAHGAVFNKESWAPLAQLLAARGHLVLAIDFRGVGASTPGRDDKALYQDVLAAVRYVRAHGATSVGVVGASMGGGAAARAAVAARAGEINRLFLLSPVPIADPEAMKAGRYMYVASRHEKLAPSIKEPWSRAPEPKRLELLDGDAHAQNIFATDQGTKLTSLIADFLGRRSRDLRGPRR